MYGYELRMGYPESPDGEQRLRLHCWPAMGTLKTSPREASDWDVTVRGGAGAADSLNAHTSEARLYKELATLRTDVPMDASLESLEWKGVDREKYLSLCDELGFGRL